VTGAVAGMLARVRRPPVTGLLPDAMPAPALPAEPAAVPTLSEAAPAPGRAPARDVPVAAPVDHGRPAIAPTMPAPDSNPVIEPASLAIAPRAVIRRRDPVPDPATGWGGSRSTLPPPSRPAAARSAATDPSPAADHPAATSLRQLQRLAVPTDPAGPDGGSRAVRDTVDRGRHLPDGPVDGPIPRVSPDTPDPAPTLAPVRAEPVPPVVIESIRVEVAGPAGPAPDPFAGLRHHLGGITRWGRR
jgi:hypothetical protein